MDPLTLLRITAPPLCLFLGIWIGRLYVEWRSAQPWREPPRTRFFGLLRTVSGLAHVQEGEGGPSWLWGVAWRYWDRDYTVMAPLPFSWIIFWSIRLRAWFAFPHWRLTDKERRLYEKETLFRENRRKDEIIQRLRVDAQNYRLELRRQRKVIRQLFRRLVQLGAEPLELLGELPNDEGEEDGGSLENGDNPRPPESARTQRQAPDAARAD